MLMAANLTEAALFPLIDERHPFFVPVADFRGRLARHPAIATVRARLGDSDPIDIRTQVGGRRLSDGTWRLKSLYVSFQFAGPAERFDSITFRYLPRHMRHECYEFPDDPQLDVAAALKAWNAPRTRVLRYVPTRRLTLATSWEGRPVVAKVLREADLPGVLTRLDLANQAVARSPVGFALPQVLAADARTAVMIQTRVPGVPLANDIGAWNLAERLFEAGSLHREVHCVDGRGFARWSPAAFLDDTLARLEWIGLFVPWERARLDAARKALMRNLPVFADNRVSFCHGDFRCSHILSEGDTWSLVDFDDCLRADPYLELGRFLAFLKYDLPLIADAMRSPASNWNQLLERGQSAYLDGYREQSQQPLDARRLAWFHLAGEIACFAQLLRRDLADQLTCSRALQLIRKAAEQLDATAPGKEVP